MGKQYGTYTEVECRKEAGTYEKYEALKRGMERLIKKIVPDMRGPKPDYDTMTFIVHESWRQDAADPLSEEKTEGKKKEVMTIGVKWMSLDEAEEAMNIDGQQQ